jgi:methyltransferase (TIGR00027 family)
MDSKSAGRRRLRGGSSAEKMTFLRALAALEGDPSVRGPDSMAADFLADLPTVRASLRRAARWPFVHGAIRWSVERLGPGAYWSHLARTKHFDKVLLDEVSAGIGQVVILNAGLDSRAYRFSAELGAARLFEVDLPAMSARKAERLRALFGQVPAAVSYVTADLSKESLGDLLTGLDDRSAVLVLWSAGAPLLPAEVLTDVLRWVSTLPPGSSVVFDYLDQAFFDPKKKTRGARRLRYGFKNGGEHLLSGLDPAAVPALLDGCGLALKSHLGPRDQEMAYLYRADGRLAGRPIEQARIVQAEVRAK